MLQRLSLRSSIRQKMLLVTLGLAIPALILIGWLSLSSLDQARATAVDEMTTALQQQAEATLRLRAVDKAKFYDSTLLGIQQQVESTARYATTLLATNPPLANAQRVWLAPNSLVNAAQGPFATAIAHGQQLTPLLQAMGGNNQLVRLGSIALEAGGVLAVSDAAALDRLVGSKPFDPRTRPWYTNAITADSTIWTDADVDANTNILVSTCATPLRTATGQALGAVGFDLLLSTIQQDLLTEAIGTTGYAFLVNGQGKIVVRPASNAARAHWDQPLHTEDLRTSANEQLRTIARTMQLQRESGSTHFDYNGTTVYLAYAPLFTTNWSVALVIPADEVGRAAEITGERIAEREKALRTQLLGILIAIIAAIIALGILLSINLTRPIKALQAGARRIADGHLDQRIPSTERDEIGQLVELFNTMTDALQQKMGELEHHVRRYDDLERQVAHRTEELRAALDRAQLADRRKSSFLAAISHELRTPLNAIIGFSAVLLDDPAEPLSPTQHEDIQSINRNGRFLLHLINEVLDLAKIEAGYLALDRTPVQLDTVIAEVIDTIQVLMRGRGILLRTALPPDLPAVYADVNRLRQILLNLISNAVKFTEQGSITVRAFYQAELQTVAVSIRDTGIGIPSDQLERIFDEFRQVHSKQSPSRGTGLGLAITKKLIEAHHGHITVESSVGQGCTFTFTLPINPTSTLEPGTAG